MEVHVNAFGCVIASSLKWIWAYDTHTHDSIYPGPPPPANMSDGISSLVWMWEWAAVFHLSQSPCRSACYFFIYLFLLSQAVPFYFKTGCSESSSASGTKHFFKAVSNHCESLQTSMQNPLSHIICVTRECLSEGGCCPAGRMLRVETVNVFLFL